MKMNEENQITVSSYSIHDLPIEIFQKIVKLLDIKSLMNVCMTCKR